MSKEKQSKGNIVLAKFKKDQSRENKNRKWDKVSSAVSAARDAYVGRFEQREGEKTVGFDKALGDLVEVLQKIQAGQLNLGGLETEKIEIEDTMEA